MTDIAIPQEAELLAKQTGELATVPANIVVKTPADYEMAGAKLQEFSAREKQVEEMRKRLKAPILAAGKAIDAFFDTPIKRLQSARAAYKTALLEYQQVQERERRALEAKAQEEARKEREKLEAQAAKLAAKGKTEAAEAKAAQAQSVITPIIAPMVQKLPGISTRVTYRAVVLDKLELVKAVAAGIVPINALDVNMAFLNNQARAMKETLAYPGVKAEQDVGIASRSA